MAHTNQTEDKTYRTLIEEMHEGAVILNEDGSIFYSNTHFSRLVNVPLQILIGANFTNFIDHSSKEVFGNLFKQGWQKSAHSEVYINSDQGMATPVLMSVNKLLLENIPALSIIITDLTTQKKNEEELMQRATELELKNSQLESANRNLALQNEERESRAHELMVLNRELAFQNTEKEKRAAELSIANIELTFNNNEKETRAAELIIANQELAFQNTEKEKRAVELSIANLELTFNNDEKEKRAAELIIANRELAFQNVEKEKRAVELSIANQDLTSFTYISSHDLQEPLRKIQNFVSCILREDEQNLSESGKDYFKRLTRTALRMQELIEDLLAYSRSKLGEHVFVETDLNALIKEVIGDFDDVVHNRQATIEIQPFTEAVNIIPFQFRQLYQNLINNAFKFSRTDINPIISIENEIRLGSEMGFSKLLPDRKYCHITLKDNGIGFDPQYKERIFEVFQRLHSYEEYHGTGIGLAICKRIVENHNGFITAIGKPDEGAQFDVYILFDR